MSVLRSDHVYLQPMEAGESNRLLVMRSQFDVPPKTSWFYKVLVDPTWPDAPLMADAGDGLPVYYVDVPRAILMELVACAKDPRAARRAWARVPEPIHKTCDTTTWQEYADRFLPTRSGTKPPGWFPSPDELRLRTADESAVYTGIVHLDDFYVLFGAAMNLPYIRKQKCITVAHEPSATFDLVRAGLVSLGYTVTKMPLQPLDLPGHVRYTISW